MFEDAQTFFQKTLALGPNLIEAHYELGRARWFAGDRDGAHGDVARRLRGEQVQSMGQAVRGGAGDGGGWRGATPRVLSTGACRVRESAHSSRVASRSGTGCTPHVNRR